MAKCSVGMDLSTLVYCNLNILKWQLNTVEIIRSIFSACYFFNESWWDMTRDQRLNLYCIYGNKKEFLKMKG